jgi:hypothetical protein
MIKDQPIFSQRLEVNLAHFGFTLCLIFPAACVTVATFYWYFSSGIHLKFTANSFFRGKIHSSVLSKCCNFARLCW